MAMVKHKGSKSDEEDDLEEGDGFNEEKVPPPSKGTLRRSSSRASMTAAAFGAKEDNKGSFLNFKQGHKDDFEKEQLQMLAKYRKNKTGSFDEKEVLRILEGVQEAKYNTESMLRASKRIAENLNTTKTRSKFFKVRFPLNAKRLRPP
jgi:hypothetical protein